MRAVAIMRTSSSRRPAGCSASGVPSTGTSALIGTLSGCGSRFASVRSIPQRSSSDSPMPMMPPEHTVMPALRTLRERAQPVVVGAGRDDRPVVLARGVEVVVVGGQAGLGQALRLRLGRACPACSTPPCPARARRAPSPAPRRTRGRPSPRARRRPCRSGWRRRPSRARAASSTSGGFIMRSALEPGVVVRRLRAVARSPRGSRPS